MAGDHATSELARRLAGTVFTELRWVTETGSTNADLLEQARAGAPEGRVLVADHQTAGRGRLDRSWEAPPGSSLLMSVLLRPALEADQVHLLSMALGVSSVLGVQRVAGVSPRLKWPNDLVLDTPAGERKLAGILAEAELGGEGVVAVVLGLGLNVRWPTELPPGLAETAVALDHVTDRPVDRGDLLVEILRGLHHYHERLGSPSGREGLRWEYRASCATIGRRVHVQLGAETLEGTAVEIAPTGALVLDTSDGRREVAAGDVVHLRPL